MSKKILIQSLIKVKNAGISNCNFVEVKNIKLNRDIFELLYKEGFISAVIVKNCFILIIVLKYYNGYFLLKNLKIFSNFIKPKYLSYDKLLKIYYGSYKMNYFMLLNTSYGLLTVQELFFRNYRIGGQVLFTIDLL